MKLSKAIEILTDQATNPDLSKFPDLKDSLLLAIEALKQIQHLKTTPCWSGEFLLPGETPEFDNKRSLHHVKEILESPIGREPKD